MEIFWGGNENILGRLNELFNRLKPWENNCRLCLINNNNPNIILIIIILNWYNWEYGSRKNSEERIGEEIYTGSC